MVVVVARGSQDFKRQVSYDRRGSATTVGGGGSSPALRASCSGRQAGAVYMFHDQPGTSFLKSKCRKKHLAMVKTREAVFSKVLTFFGIRHLVPST